MNTWRPITKGSTDVSVIINIIDATDGTPETGVEHDTSGIDLSYRREGGTVVSITEAALASADAAHSDGGIEHLFGGAYRLDLPDAACAASADEVIVGGTITGMIVIPTVIPLVDYDPYDSVRMGMTALPNAAADAAGGLPISDAGGLDLDTLLGYLTAAVATASALTTAQNDLDTITGSDGVTLATAQGNYAPAKAGDAMDLITDALDGDAVAATAVSEIQSGLATGTALQTVDDEIAAIQGDVTTIAGDVANIDGDAMRGTDSAATASALSTLAGTIATLDALLDKLRGYFQLSVRSDAAIETDRATEFGELNADEGSGAGNFSAQSDSLEAIRDTEPLGTAMRGTDGANTTTPPTVGDIQAELEENGASILDTLQDRLTAARAGNLDELGAANVPADIDTLLTRITDAVALAADLATTDGKVDTINTNAARLTAARAQVLTDLIDGGRLDLLIDAIKAVTDLLNAAQAEPTGVPAANETPLDKVGWLFMALRNALTITDSKKSFYDDDGNVEWEKDLTDNGTTYSESEANAP